MSTDSATIGTAPGYRAWDLRKARIYRFALGVTLALGISFAGGWPLFYITPVLVTFILALKLPSLTLRQGLVGFLFIFAGFGIGMLFALLLMPFPLIAIPLLGLVLFHIYYLANRGGPQFLVIMMILGVLILPVAGQTHDVIAAGIASAFVGSGLLAVILVWLAHGLVPDPEYRKPPARPSRRKMAGYAAPAARAALKSTIVTLPLAVAFLTFDWINQIMVLIYAALFSLVPEVSSGKAAALTSMTSTLIGGAAALLFYGLLILVPEFYFFLALALLFALLFASRIFSEYPYAPYMSSAFIALIVLVAGSLGGGASITGELALRVLLISLATFYMVTALRFLDWLSARLGSR